MGADYKSALVTTATWNSWPQSQRDQYGGTRQYTTINAWVAAQQTRDIVTLDENNVLECYNDFGVGLYEKAVISGFIQGPNNKVIITSPPGERHTGKPGTGFRLYHDQVWANVLDVQISNFEVQHLEIELENGGGIAIQVYQASDWSNTINGCIVSGGDQTIYGRRFLVYNSLLHDCTSAAIDSPSWYSYESINNVFANNATVISAAATDTTKESGISLSNCAFYGNTTDIKAGLNFYAPETNTNATDSATTPPGPGSFTGVVAGDFIDTAGNDFHIPASSALKGAGTDYSAKFLNDIDDEPWVVPWSIGFDQPTAGGTAITGSGSLIAGNANSSGLAIRQVKATGAIQAGPATFTGTAERKVKATGALQSSAAQTAGSGSVGGNIAGSGALASANANMAGSATRHVKATGAIQAGPATFAGTAERKVKATGALQSSAAQTAGSGSVGGNIAGSGALASANAGMSGVAVRQVNATATIQSDPASAAGSGGINGGIAGNGALTAGPALFAGAAERTIKASGILQSSASQASGSGSIGGQVSGAGNLLAGNSILAGTGIRKIIGAGAFQASAALFAGVAVRQINAAGTIQSGPAAAAGGGTVGNIVSGSGALLVAPALLSGLGAKSTNGAGSLQAGNAQSSGTATRFIVGTGAMQSDVATLSGYDILFVGGNKNFFIESRGRNFKGVRKAWL